MSKTGRAIARRGIIGFAGGKFGLRAPETMKILPGRSYWYGASSTPSCVYVAGTEGEYVLFYYENELRVNPVGAPLHREQSWIFCDLAARGTRTVLEQDEHAARVCSESTTYYAERANVLRAKLAGDEAGAPFEPVERFMGARIYLRAVPERVNGDPWYVAEEYGGVAGITMLDGSYIYLVETTIERARRAAEDPRFVVCNSGGTPV